MDDGEATAARRPAAGGAVGVGVRRGEDVVPSAVVASSMTVTASLIGARVAGDAPRQPRSIWGSIKLRVQSQAASANLGAEKVFEDRPGRRICESMLGIVMKASSQLDF